MPTFITMLEMAAQTDEAPVNDGTPLKMLPVKEPPRVKIARVAASKSGIQKPSSSPLRPISFNRRSPRLCR